MLVYREVNSNDLFVSLEKNMHIVALFLVGLFHFPLYLSDQTPSKFNCFMSKWADTEWTATNQIALHSRQKPASFSALKFKLTLAKQDIPLLYLK